MMLPIEQTMAMAKRAPRVEPRQVTPLKMAIVASGFTTQEIADRIGVHASVLSRWAAEPNKRRVPKVDQALALAGALGKTVDELWPETDRAAA